MRARLRSSRAGLGLLGAGILLALAAGTLPRSSRAALSSAGGGLQGSAQHEFLRARREQALIRAETTALLLHALAAAPTLPGAGP